MLRTSRHIPWLLWLTYLSWTGCADPTSVPGVSLDLSQARQWQAAGQFDSAAWAYQQALPGQPDSSRAATHLSLSECLRYNGEAEAALAQADTAFQALRQAPQLDSLALARALLAQAQAQIDLGAYDQAESLIGQARQDWLAILPDTALPVLAAADAQARLYYYQGQYEAIGPLARKVLRHRRTALPEGHPDRVEAFERMAIFFLETNQPDSALYYAQQAEAAALAAWGDTHLLFGNLLSLVAHVHTRRGEYEQALAYQQRIARITEAVLGPHHLSLGQDFNNLGVGYHNLGREHEAIPYYRRAAEIFAQSGMYRPFIANNFLNLGILYKDLGQLDSAYHFLQAALVHYDSLGAEKTMGLHVATVYNALGNVLVAYKDHEAAAIYYRRSLDLFVQHLPAIHFKKGELYNNLGQSLIETRQLEAGLAMLDSARKQLMVAFGPEHPYTGFVLNNIAEAYHLSGQPEAARRLHQQALSLRLGRLGPDHPETWTSQGNLARAECLSGATQQGLSRYQAAIEGVQARYGTHHWLAAVLEQGMGECLLQAGQAEMARQHFQRALQATLPGFDATQPEAFPERFETLSVDALLGSLVGIMETYRLAYQHQPRADQLMQLVATGKSLIQAVSTSRQHASSPPARSRLSQQVSQAYTYALDALYTAQQQEQLSPAEAAGQAFAFFEANRSLGLQDQLRDHRAREFAGLPDSVLRQERQLLENLAFEQQAWQAATSDSARQAHQARLVRLRTHWDRLRERLAQDYPAYFQLKYAPDPSDWEELLPETDSTLWLAYFWGKDHLYCWQVQAGQPQLRRIERGPAFEARLQRLLRTLDDQRQVISQMHSPQMKQQLAQDAHELYLHLLPTERLSRASGLVIAPDGPLSLLPFEVLLTALPQPQQAYRDWPYLLRAHRVRYVFSATSQALSQRRRQGGKGVAGFAPIYPANDSIPDYPGRNLGPLFNNQEEVSQIKAVVQGRAFLGKGATEASFREEAGSYQVLHLAMHALLDDEDPLRSCLVFTPEAEQGRPERSDGVLHAYEIYHLPLEAELAVLSACHSGQGDFRPGEGLVSLGRAFAYAGCANTVMSLWQADDAAAATLMGRFYHHLASGLPKDEALRQARLDYLASEDLTHPHFWGNFVLFGDREPVEVKPRRRADLLFWGKIALLLLGLVGVGGWWWRKARRQR